MQFKDAIQQAQSTWEAGQPFVLYALPDSDRFTLILGQEDKVPTHTAGYFIFAPFDVHVKTYSLTANLSKMVEGPLDLQGIPSVKTDQLVVNALHKANHIRLVERAIDVIGDGNLSKVVVSRKAEIGMTAWSLPEIAKRLVSLYPTSFRYLWFHPQTGLWCGATPETLVQVSSGEFHTMSLAGTKTSNDIPWTEKERREQKIVTEEIVSKLQPQLGPLSISEAHDQTAGPLIHLRTDIRGPYDANTQSVQELAQLLHPTPAVCGFPFENARAFIHQFEGYDRSYYTGYLGPIDLPKTQSHLYVNLRCMRLDRNRADIFVGGGITLDSIPESEWLETQHKMQTMLQVLAPYLSH